MSRAVYVNPNTFNQIAFGWTSPSIFYKCQDRFSKRTCYIRICAQPMTLSLLTTRMTALNGDIIKHRWNVGRHFSSQKNWFASFKEFHANSLYQISERWDPEQLINGIGRPLECRITGQRGWSTIGISPPTNDCRKKTLEDLPIKFFRVSSQLAISQLTAN